jgi:hypothetical protein
LTAAELRAKIELINELESEAGQFAHKAEVERLMERPPVRLCDAVKDAAAALRQFTFRSISVWMESKYPGLFKSKSIRKPLQDMEEIGELKLIRQSQGKGSPAVYEYVGTTKQH